KLAIHWRGAGDLAKASHYTVLAASQASDSLAFDRAAELYRTVLADPGDGRSSLDLRIKLGHALANAGRGAEAAEAFLSAAQTAEAAERLELQRRAAEQLLRSGHIKEGMATIQSILDRVDLRLAKTIRGALVSLLLHRLLISLRGFRFEKRTAD